MSRTKLIAEIGINHNGDIQIAKDLIIQSKLAGFDYVKIQKRNPDLCVPEHQKGKEKETPWGKMTYLEYKESIEFNEDQIKELKEFSDGLGISFFASVWDLDSVEIMKKYCSIGKIPSALITDLELCKAAREAFYLLIISTGMSTEEEIEKCVEICNPDVIMHTNSTYPCPVEDINLNYIKWLKKKYPRKEIGYSGHEYGLTVSFAAVAMGAMWVERHVTINREMWGSDQKSSIQPEGMIKLVRGIRDIEKACSHEEGERILFEKEKIKRESLRK